MYLFFIVHEKKYVHNIKNFAENQIFKSIY